jgi:hypothetical protein
MTIETLSLDQWSVADQVDARWQEALENGAVLYCPKLAFHLEEREQRFLDPSFSDSRRKSIYIRADRPGLFGTEAQGIDRDALSALLKRFDTQAMGLLARLFPSYAAHMRAAGTSFRPRSTSEQDQALSWRKDDTRLHVDAFPSNPTRGTRLLRVFSNVGTTPRVWRVGEPFADMARHFLPGIPAPLPGFAPLIRVLGITKRERSAYDHYMLYLHDRAKADLEYQAHCPQERVEFMPGSSWICFSDQVMHAAIAGQFMIEQTVHVPLEALAYPELSPLAQLEAQLQRRLLPRETRLAA